MVVLFCFIGGLLLFAVRKYVWCSGLGVSFGRTEAAQHATR